MLNYELKPTGSVKNERLKLMNFSNINVFMSHPSFFKCLITAAIESFSYFCSLLNDLHFTVQPVVILNQKHRLFKESCIIMDTL